LREEEKGPLRADYLHTKVWLWNGAEKQVCRRDAWHHHMALVMLATLFLTWQKIQGRKQWPILSFNDLVTVLTHLLPGCQFTAKELAVIIDKRHYLRKKTKESHASRSQRMRV